LWVFTKTMLGLSWRSNSAAERHDGMTELSTVSASK
jgi:hypothetical protein